MGETVQLVPGRVEWRRVGEEVVVLDMAEQRYLAVNPSGSVLWPLLDRGAAPEELVATLAEGFGLPHDVARHDVEAFVADLEARGVVRTRHEPA